MSGLQNYSCASAFVVTAPSSSTTATTNRPLLSVISAVTTSSSIENDDVVLRVPDGANEFEAWCRQQAPAAASSLYVHPALSHALFPGRVRGLQWNMDAPAPEKNEPILRIPKSMVLSCTYDKEKDQDWDANLACALWKEMLAGDKSFLAGYCNWLKCVNGDEATPSGEENNWCPPSTAPNALRRWSEEQKSLLASQSTGQEVLDLAQRQETAWRLKYNKRQQEQPSSMTWEQFQWCMEVVHSRAFCGLGDASSISPLSLASIAAPVVAAVAGYVYTQIINPFSGDDPTTTTAILVGLGGLAVLPAVFQQLQPQTTSAVLLPWIDSANHLEQADSKLFLDPVSQTFDLAIGPACLVPVESSSDGVKQQQVFISYGPRGDRELLLNYGFLPNVAADEDNTEDGQRKRLAEAFLERNQ